MTNKPSFSERHGLAKPLPEVTVRHDAPEWLRDFVIKAAYDAGLKPSTLRSILCKQLLESPDPNNWSDFPNIDGEVRDLLHNADWFEVYDFIELVADNLFEMGFGSQYGQESQGTTEFRNAINAAFKKKGIGWQLLGSEIQIRGEESFEKAVRQSHEALASTGRTVASHEMHQALADLSKRPEPDVTGAIQHAMAALECVARDVSGNPNPTLGELLKKHPGLLPPPLDQAVSKIWGYASERGRHLREGGAPQGEEAQLIVGLSGVLTSYLLSKADTHIP